MASLTQRSLETHWWCLDRHSGCRGSLPWGHSAKLDQGPPPREVIVGMHHPWEGRVRKHLRGGRRGPGDISCCHPGTEGRSTSWRLSCVSCLPGERAVVRLIPSLRFSALQFF